MRVYTHVEGRRDNKYKARIKILVKELGIDAFREKVEAQWQFSKDSEATLTEAEVTLDAKAFLVALRILNNCLMKTNQ